MRHTLSKDCQISRVEGDPWSQYLDWRGQVSGDGLLLVDFSLEPWWLEGAAPLALTALYFVNGGELKVSVTNQALCAEGALPPVLQYESWVAQYSLFSARPGDVLPLQPVHIPKPWGQEIWFTGVEERGVCEFGGEGAVVPIPWMQAVLAPGVAGQGSLVLLKILDPAAAEVTGDLYFELHEKKREVYVVTHVDREAWPDGTGYIRYGFDADRVAEAESEAAFRDSYYSAVKAYETVRRDIDGMPPGSEVSPTLSQQEVDLRRAMERYTNMRPLTVGDVVVVPLLMPHSLQHGVRTIEFQTPVYERKILSFAQQVLTQGHWDTEGAVGQMRLLPPEEVPFEILSSGDGVLVERVVDFPDFEVRRIRVAWGCEAEISLAGHYGVAILVEGRLRVDGREFGPEEALFIPAGRPLCLVPREPAQDLTLLLAVPRI